MNITLQAEKVQTGEAKAWFRHFITLVHLFQRHVICRIIAYSGKIHSVRDRISNSKNLHVMRDYLLRYEKTCKTTRSC